jgi:hypothetical protein
MEGHYYSYTRWFSKDGICSFLTENEEIWCGIDRVRARFCKKILQIPWNASNDGARWKWVLIVVEKLNILSI